MLLSHLRRNKPNLKRVGLNLPFIRNLCSPTSVLFKTDDSFSHQLPLPSKAYSQSKMDVWTMFNKAATEFNSVNLGQGFMSFPPHEMVKKAGVDSIVLDSCSQYSTTRGRPRLLKALANHYSDKLGFKINPDTDVMVSTGANEDGKNEAIVMEPAFDQYTPNIEMAGGKVVYIPLRVDPSLEPEKKVISSNDWKLNIKELESKINERTKLLIINTPHNPSGKVFSIKELTEIADVAKKYNLLVVSDEVYENLYFEGNKHISIATLPGMFDRTLIVGSMGKSFEVTGWRLGWLIGPKHLIDPCIKAHTRTVFVSSNPIQEACAISLENTETTHPTYFSDQRNQYLLRRNKLMKAFDNVGLPYSVPNGSYFLLVNANRVQIPSDFAIPAHIAERGKCFIMSYFFTTEIGVSCIPPSEFYCQEDSHLADDYVRFAFCKDDLILEEAAKRLEKVKKYVK
ncbi:putative aminotransferase [Smittium mucronatum]|uniref:Putative aminotransferase n=1 Tax=Smittium mucronatum TaxID=133383 RepID=A0A1R0H304_9FUNG|nr:putative aminotransferase [Smittium mucronatum]